MDHSSAARRASVRFAQRGALASLALLSLAACGTPDADELVSIEQGFYGQVSSSSDTLPPKPTRYYEGRSVGVITETTEWKITTTDEHGFFAIEAPPGVYLLCEAQSESALVSFDDDIVWGSSEADAESSSVEVEGYSPFLVELGEGRRRCDHSGGPPLWQCE